MGLVRPMTWGVTVLTLCSVFGVGSEPQVILHARDLTEDVPVSCYVRLAMTWGSAACDQAIFGPKNRSP